MAERSENWKAYDKRREKQPRTWLVENMRHVVGRELAVDVGAGPLVETRFLLDQGFTKVIAIDTSRTDDENVADLDASRIDYVIAPAQDVDLPASSADLVCAQYSLPFVGPEHFAVVVQKCIAALKPGGIFCGQFFGTRDSWNDGKRGYMFVDKEDVASFFSDCELIECRETESDAPGGGEMKHWHVFHIVAKKKDAV